MKRCRHFMALAALAALTGLPLGLVRAQTSSAPLRVIYDSGQALPLGPYVSYLLSGAEQDGVLEGISFPLTTRLPSALLQADEVPVFDAKWMTEPMFLIGTDKASIAWLQLNHARLFALKAWGLVLQAPDAASFKVLQRLAPDLPLAPVQSAWLEQHLIDKGAGVLPLLLQSNGTARQIVLGNAP